MQQKSVIVHLSFVVNDFHMKRLLLLICLLCSAASLSAQGTGPKEKNFSKRFPYRYELRLGYGATPMYDTDNFMRTGYFYKYDYVTGPYEPSLDNLYRVQEGSRYVSGVFTGEFSIHYRRWFTLAFSLGVNGMWGNEYDPLTEIYTRKSGVSFNLMPVARFNWFTFSKIRMYSAVGAGLYAGFYDDDAVVTPAGMLVPVGITLGKKFFFFAETVISTATMGGNMGIGYRF